MTATTTFAELLKELADAFEQCTRADGETRYYKLKDDCPDWIDSDMMLDVHRALDDRFPDDWVYESAAGIADDLEAYDVEDADDARERMPDIADSQVDMYYHDQNRWLASHLGNAEFCEEARENGIVGPESTMSERIVAGQYIALERIGIALIEAVESELEIRD